MSLNLKLNMENPFTISDEKRGHPDTGFHQGNPQHQQTNNTSTLIRFPLLHCLLLLLILNLTWYQSPLFLRNIRIIATILTTIILTTLIRKLLIRMQLLQGESTGPVFEFNTEGNINKKGQQRGGNIRTANAVVGAGPAINFPQNGRFVFNTGKNHNEGEIQENGNVEFGNVG